MNFGPLSNDGGERRLNVSITRRGSAARCSPRSGRTTSTPPRQFSRGQSAENLLEVRGNRAYWIQDCPLAEVTIRSSSVRSRARWSEGYQIVPQVGVAGFLHRLSRRRSRGARQVLAGHRVRRSQLPQVPVRGMTEIASEQEVLEDRRWDSSSIWSTDWFHRPDDELRKAMAAIERAKIEWAKRSTVEDRPADQPVPEPTEIVRTECNGNGCEGHGCSPSQPYVVASFRINTNRQIHEVSPAELAPVVLKIIKVEGPIHGEEIARRVTQLWGLRRTGKRIRDAVAQAIRSAARSSGVQHDGEFYSLSSQPEVLVRDRGDVAVATLRRPEMLPPAEVRKSSRSHCRRESRRNKR